MLAICIVELERVSKSDRRKIDQLLEDVALLKTLKAHPPGM